MTGTAGGATILVFGLFAFSIQDIIIKYFSSGFSVLQIVFVRGLIAMALLLILFRALRETIALLSKRPLLMLFRGLLPPIPVTTSPWRPCRWPKSLRSPLPCRCSSPRCRR